MKKEPEAGEGVINLVFRFPEGQRTQRRFLFTDTIQYVYDFIETCEIDFECRDSFSLLQTFPRLSLDDKEKTLAEYFPGEEQATL